MKRLEFVRVMGGVIAASLLLMFMSPLAHATDYSGTCTGVVPAGSHQLTGFCTVPLGQTWTLQPGAVLSGNGQSLSVNGTLNMDQASVTQAFINFNAGSSGAMTGNTFNNTSSTSACLFTINDASPSFTSSNTFQAGVGVSRWMCVGGSSIASPAQPLISGNSFDVNYSGGGIDVGGTAQPTISNNTIDIIGGTGLSFEDNAAGTASANTLSFELDTASNRSGISVIEDSSPVVSANIINDDTARNDFGLVLQFSSASSAAITGNTVGCSGADIPIRLGPGPFANASPANVSTNVFGCPTNGVAQLAGSLDSDSTLSAINGISSFDLWTTLTVPVPWTLTIPVGAALEGVNNTLTVNGTLNIDQATITQTFINYSTGSAGSITASTFINTSSTSACLINITDASPTINSGNNFPVGIGVSRLICVGGTSLVTPAQPLISGNTLDTNYSGGGIDVGGTAQPTISNNNISITGGTGISFEDNSAGSATNNTLTFSLDTAVNRSAISLIENASPTVTTNTIVDDTFRSDFGLVLQFSTLSTAIVTNNTVGCSGGDTPVRFGAGVFGDSFAGNVSANTYNCPVDGVAQLAGSLDGDSTLSVVDGISSYSLWTTLTIPANNVLSIPAGISLNGVNNSITVNGALNIDQANITQTFINYTSGTQGSITGATFDNTSSSSGCRITITDSSPTITGANNFLAGVGITRWICVGGTSVVNPAQPMISGNTFNVNYSGGGIDVGGTAQPTISNNTMVVTGGVGISFEDNSAGVATNNTLTFQADTASNRNGFLVFDNASPNINTNTIVDDTFRADIPLVMTFTGASSASVTGNTIGCSGGDVPLRVGPGVFSDTFSGTVSGNNFSCALAGAIQLSGSLDSNSTLSPVDSISSLSLFSTLTIPVGRTLTIPAGISLNGTNNSITINGELNIDQANITQVFLNYTTTSTGSITASTFDDTSSSSGCRITITDSSPSITGNNNFLPGVGVTRWVCVGGSAQPPQALPLISGNTFNTNYSGGGIDVGGTSQATISNNTINVFGGTGMTFEDTAIGTATGNNIVFEPNGAANRTAIHVFDSASPNVSTNSIVDDDNRNDTGLRLVMTAASTAIVTANNVDCSGGDTPLTLGPGPLADAFPGNVTGNIFTCLQNSVSLGGIVAADTTLGLFDGLTQYQLNTTLTISAGANLSIPAESTLLGVNNTMTVNGNVNVSGTIDNVFVQVNNGGDFSADGMTKVNSNDWINYDAGSSGTIANSLITGTSGTGVFIADSDVSITGTTLSGWATAIRLDGTTGAATIVFDGNTFENNTIGIDIDSGLNTFTAANNLFVNNSYSLDFDTDDGVYSAYPASFGSSSFVGGPARNLLRLPSTFNTSGIFPVAPAPFYSPGMTISGGAQVTLFGGTVIASGAFTTITVNADSRLVASGSEFFPVVFTDFNVDDASAWSGLTIRSDDSLLQNCVVEFSRVDGLRLEGASIDVTNCRISSNLGDGVEMTLDASPTFSGGSFIGNIGDGIKANQNTAPVPGPVSVTQNSLFSNGGFGINNIPATFNVEALNNYWGDDSGPFDGSDDTGVGGLFNPAGLGQSVDDNVLYDPWIRLGPTQEGSIIPVSGGNQMGVVGQTLPLPLVVRIESLLTTPIENVEVIFSVVSGDATIVEAQPVLSAANGEAQATVQLGLTPGPVLFAVTARDVNSPLATFMGDADNPCLVELQVFPVDLRAGSRDWRGDVNGDGIINNQDAALIHAVVNGQIAPNSMLVPNWRRTADVNGDGRIDSGDALVAQGVQIGMISQGTSGPISQSAGVR